MTFQTLSLRRKLLFTFVAVIVIGGLASLLVGSRLVRETLISQAQSKVRHDLSAARMVFDEKLKDIRDLIGVTAAREGLREAVSSGRVDTLHRYLNRVRMDSGLDTLNVTDNAGRILVRTRRPEAPSDDLSSDDLVRRALRGGLHSGVQIISREELLREGEDLAVRARINILPTPRAADQAKTVETSGMMLRAAAALQGEDGRILGALCGGILINRNYEIVDRVKELVYKGERYKGREIGTATIFQNDLRISTNVRNRNGDRAVGTRVSRQVREAVLVRGRPWIDRAFVVNDWYITAYEPLRNPEGDIIGVLYVGLLEKPYLDTAARVMSAFILLAGLCVLFLLLMLFLITGRITKPLRNIAVATQEIARGDLSHRVKVESRDEVGRLADSFNRMTDNLEKANESLLEWTRTLEKRVEERTRELQEAQAGLVQSEKLASLGKLAAGIAHEINNPLGGILIYSHLTLEDTPQDSPAYENLRKIVKETTRCKNIVRGLLEFARPKDPEMILTSVADIIEKALALLERQTLFQNIVIRKDFAPLPRLVVDVAQLQQVFMNIIINAAEAMAGRGTLTIRAAADKKAGWLSVEFIDTGHGIKPEDRERLFDPFFTTKEVGRGTGLGLSISYSIIKKHSGKILVRNEQGGGAVFSVLLPLNRAKVEE
ncbi:MAG: cache domain-containing protein [Candidatus Aminicenantes bacterium]|nr:cache domain-containing protein [Candidatus Aminicenantes bacterium]